MATKLDIKDKMCAVYFVYSDGSRIRTVTTLNKEFLALRGINSNDEEFLIDLDTNRIIPDEMLKLDCEVYLLEEDKDMRTELDKFLDELIKNNWEMILL